MPLRHLTLLTKNTDNPFLDEIENMDSVIEFWSHSKPKNGHKEYKILVESDNLQDLVDKMQSKLSKDEGWRVIISPVETTIPRVEGPELKDSETNENAKKSFGSMTREALYDQILKGTSLNQDFFILIVLSAIVTAIGLVTNNIAVIIGAMVIAPLLGPNLALSFGVALGERGLVTESLKANTFGMGLSVALGVAIGLIIPYESYAENQEYLIRTTVGYEAIILALASGAAGVLSLTSGVSSAMVGVMVAVSLMPPAIALGLSTGAGAIDNVYGSGLLLAINIVCVNIAAKAVFTFKGIKPRTWYRRKKSTQSLKTSLGLWIGLLTILVALIYLWQQK